MINIAKISQAWKLSPILSTSTPTTGNVHQTLLLRTYAGDYALRAYRYEAEERWRINYEHAIIIYGHAHGLPTLCPLPLSNGQTILEMEGRFYALFPHARGYQNTSGHLSQSEVSAMGNGLAQIHQALHDYPHESLHHRSFIVDPEATLKLIDDIETAIQAQISLDKNEQDQQTLSLLNERRSWVTTIKAVSAREFMMLEQQAVHGDYQETNLFFEDNKLSAVIDWDQAHIAPRAWEVIRAFDYGLKLDATSCHNFLRAYRQILPLSATEIQVAATFYDWLRAFDVWIYEEIYLRGNQRVRSFLRPGPFIPFIQRWKHVQESLSAN